MADYVIVSDVDNIIKYGEIQEVNRLEVADHRARLEALKEQKASIEAEIAELEALIEKDEYIVKLADEKKAEEDALNNPVEAPVVEETPIVE